MYLNGLNAVKILKEDDLLRVVVLGVGGVGQVCAAELAKKSYVKTLILGDISIDYAEEFINKLRSTTKTEILVHRVDASKVESVVQVSRKADVLIHAGLPDYNIPVMKACLETGTHYIDMASNGPKWLLEQLDWDPLFKKRGILGIMGIGCDPGFSNIAARYAVDQMDSVHSIMIRDGDNSMVDYDGFCAYFSPQTAIKECLAKPNYWTADQGEQFFPDPFFNKEEFEFPEPIGWLDCYNVEHEEVTTLGETIGKQKGCQYVDFKYALHPDFVNTLKVLAYLGLDSDEMIEVNGVGVIPRDVVVTTMPKPSDLAGKIHGYSCVGALVKGIQGDRSKELYVYTLANHDEVYKKTGFQATVWQTGVPPVAAVELIAKDVLKGKHGCIPPELIDPIPFLSILKTMGMEWHVIEKTGPITKRNSA
jgi:saccharopine dehydrogenase (NAD+, L-lysine forming)